MQPGPFDERHARALSIVQPGGSSRPATRFIDEATVSADWQRAAWMNAGNKNMGGLAWVVNGG